MFNTFIPVPIYTAEVAPNHLRGALGVNWQQADALGIFAGFACNLIIFSIPAVKKIAWRLQTATALIPTVCLLLILYLVPGEQLSVSRVRQLLKPAVDASSRTIPIFTSVNKIPLTDGS